MKFNVKVILLGGVAFYAAQWLVGMVSGPLLHQGILTEAYQATASFWRPELNQQPPDMAALLPRWIATGLIAAFIMAAIFDNIRGALDGAAWMKGLKFGVIVFLFTLCITAGWSGIFNLPDMIWVWWNVEAFVSYLIAGAVLGWVTGKLSPE